MKKASIVTIFDNTNFGTYLQTLALSHSIKEKGYCVEIVKYIRRRQTAFFMFKEALNKSPMKMMYNLFVKIPRILLLRKQDYIFMAKYFPLTKTYYSFSELQKNPPFADIYVTGSDQVWNSTYNGGLDRAYFLDFVPKESKKIAYSASIGMDRFPVEEENEVQKLLSAYNSISVREKKAIEILGSLGITNVSHVLDPTLLLDKSQWLKLVDTKCFRKKEPYLLLYSVESLRERQLIEDIAIRIAKKRCLKIYAIYYSGIETKFKCSDSNFYYATPDMFISLFSQADYVVVSSFHGTAFAVNFNKQFVSISPKHFNSRVSSLLGICGLENRYIYNKEDYKDDVDDYPIDYIKVNDILSRERLISDMFINDSLANNNIKPDNNG